MTQETEFPARSEPGPGDDVRSPVDRGVGRLEPERRECDAPVCPWCDRQGWDTCGSYYDTYTCEAAL